MKYIDQLSYSIDEVPQVNLLDPDIHLPLNSEKLVTTELERHTDKLVKEEEIQIEKELNHIDSWNKRIESITFLNKINSFYNFISYKSVLFF